MGQPDVSLYGRPYYGIVGGGLYNLDGPDENSNDSEASELDDNQDSGETTDDGSVIIIDENSLDGNDTSNGWNFTWGEDPYAEGEY